MIRLSNYVLRKAFRDAQIELTERMNELNGSFKLFKMNCPRKQLSPLVVKVKRLQHGLVKLKHKSSRNKRLPLICKADAGFGWTSLFASEADFGC